MTDSAASSKSSSSSSSTSSTSSTTSSPWGGQSKSSRSPGSDSSVYSFSAEERDKNLETKDCSPDEGRLVSFLNDGDYLDIMEQCRKELDKKTPNRSHMNHLLKQSFQRRRKEVKKIDETNEPMVSSLLQDWPAFEYGPYVSIKYLN